MFSVRGYLWAALAATAILLAVQTFAALEGGEAHILPNMLTLAPIIAGYVFGATLLAGTAGLLIAQALGWSRLICYQGIGAGLGASFAVLAWWGTREIQYTGAAAVVFALMGVVAATVYWKIANRAA